MNNVIDPVLDSNQKNPFEHLIDGEGFTAKVSTIDPLPFGNVREERDPEQFQKLRNAIKADKGVIQGVTVRVNPDDPTRLQLIAGYGRFEISVLEKFETIPAVYKIATDKEALAMMLSENINREELNIVDEIRSARNFVSYYNGDEAAAAKHLGWSLKKYQGRIVLNKCSDKVLKALRVNEIQIGHAEILSSFTHALQDITLEKIIDEQWSVEYLKERAGKATRWLKNAIFDPKDCSACVHNSDIQASLFDNTLGKAKCSDLFCFKTKTDEKLAQIKAELQESSALVLLSLEKPESDRNTVSPDNVGEEQFKSGCTGCLDNAVILTDGINQDAGEVVNNQCVNSDCFRKMLKANQPEEKVTKKKGGESTKPSNKKKTQPNKNKPKAKKVTQNTPQEVIKQNKLMLHNLSADFFCNNLHFQEAVYTATLARNFNEEPIDFKKQVIEFYKLSETQLMQQKKAIFQIYLKDKGISDTEEVNLMIAMLSNEESGSDIAVQGWNPTEALLKAYLKSSLIVIAEQSGFKKHYESIHGEKSFSSVSQRKGDLIKVLLAVSFDWSGYAPVDYLKQLTSK